MSAGNSPLTLSTDGTDTDYEEDMPPPSSEFHAIRITPTQPYMHTGHRSFVMQQIALASAELRARTVVTLRTATSGGAVTVCTLNDSCRQWCIELELCSEDRPALAVTGHDVDVVGALLPPAAPEDPVPAAASVDGDSEDAIEEGREEMDVDESSEEGEEAGEEDEEEDADEGEDEGDGESDQVDQESDESDEGGEGGAGGEGDSDEDEEDVGSEESEEADAADTADTVAEVDEVDESESDEEGGHSAPVVAAAPATAAVHPRVEAAPSEPVGGAEGDLVDMDVTCRDCSTDFVFTVQEQRFFLEHGYKIPRIRCKQCSEAKKLGNYDKSGRGATPRNKGKGKGDGDKGKGKGKGKQYSGFAPDSSSGGKGKGKGSGKGKGGSVTSDTRPCYNCGEIGHMSWSCSKPRTGKGKGSSGGKGGGGW